MIESDQNEQEEIQKDLEELETAEAEVVQQEQHVSFLRMNLEEIQEKLNTIRDSP